MNNSQFDVAAFTRGLAGAVVGGVVGFFVFNWLASMTLHAIALPGAFLGGCCGMFSRIKSIPLAVVCLVSGIALSIFCEWWNYPMIVDDSFSYFIKNLHKTDPPSKIAMVLGPIVAAWFGYGREYIATPGSGKPAE